MKTQQELCDILGFIAEYATYQLGSGVHTSRAVRNSRRIGEALGVDVQLSSFQKSTILTVLDLGSASPQPVWWQSRRSPSVSSGTLI